MDDILVIVLTLIIAGVGMLGKLKKKQQAQPAPQGGKAPASFWDLIQGPQAPQQEEVVEFDEPEYIAEGDFEEMRPEPGLAGSDYKFAAGNKREPDKNDKVKTKAKLSKSKLKREFSLRNAVIYSEILNRKYT